MAFKRFYSEPYDHNLSDITEINGKMKMVGRPAEKFQATIGHDQPFKKNFLRQISSIAEEKINNSEENAQHMSEVLANPKFTHVTSINEDEPDNKNIIISSEIPPHTIIETGLTFHRKMKQGSQWFRWNLLFNLLLWLIVPFPLWIPFISNRVAYFMIPSIQGIFVAMWISE